MKYLTLFILILTINSCANIPDRAITESAESLELSDAGDFSQFDYLDKILSVDTLVLAEKIAPLEQCLENGYYEFSYELPSIYLSKDGNMIFFKSNSKDTMTVVRESKTIQNEAAMDFIKRYTKYDFKD